MPSVIRPLFQYIAAAPFYVAPERVHAMLSLNHAIAPLINFVEGDPMVKFSVDVATGEIKVGCSALERIWAHCLAYIHLWERAQRRSGRIVDVRGTADSERSFDLLKWAVEQELKGSCGEYPAELGAPDLSSPHGSHNFAANELFLVCVGFVLHHEMGHVVLKHSPDVDDATSIQQEREADRYAADWLLGDLPSETDRRFIKRSLGVCLAQACLASLEVYGVKTAGRHPAGWDRLYSILSQYIIDGEHPAWWMACIILHLHAQNQSLPVELERQFEDPKEAADYLIDLLSMEGVAS